jgi:hypothetical protein
MTEILERFTDDGGFAPVRLQPIREAQLARFNDVLASEPARISLALEAARSGYDLAIAEGISTGDFPTLFGALVDRELMASYKASVPDWRPYIKTGTVPNFNTHEKHKISGQDTLLPQVAENGPYLEEASTTGHYHRRVYKWGRRFGISFESIINDSMGAFNDITQRFLTAVARTEARNATLTFIAATGPAPGLFGAPIADVDGQNVTNLGVLPLTITNLGITLQLMGQQTDVNGERIAVRGVHLVVPQSLEITARQILTSAFMQQVDTTGGANAVAPTYLPLPTVNVLPQYGLQLHVNGEAEAIDVSGTGDTTWYVFADTGQGVSAQLDYLRGHEAPEVCMKASNKLSIGGGAIAAMEGDFDNDSIAYRVRTIHGGSQQDPRFCYAQVGP